MLKDGFLNFFHIYWACMCVRAQMQIHSHLLFILILRELSVYTKNGSISLQEKRYLRSFLIHSAFLSYSPTSWQPNCLSFQKWLGLYSQQKLATESELKSPQKKLEGEKRVYFALV